jgi:GTP-binding protein
LSKTGPTRADSVLLENPYSSSSSTLQARWLVLNKVDMLENSADKVAEFVKAYGWKGRTFATSAISGIGCKELVYAIMDHVEEVSAKAREEDEAEQAKLAAEKLARKEAAALKRAESAE